MRDPTYMTYARATRQSGAVLMIGLVLLLVMTIIGVTAMQSTTLDEKISANAQYKMLTYQVSEAGLQQAWEHDDLGLKTLPAANPASLPFTIDASSTPALPVSSLATGVSGASADIAVVEAFIGSESNPVVPGYSLGAGHTGFFYDVDSTATIGGANARSRHRRGAVVMN